MCVYWQRANSFDTSTYSNSLSQVQVDGASTPFCTRHRRQAGPDNQICCVTDEYRCTVANGEEHRAYAN